MRFHFGLSFRPKSLLKYIGLGFFGLLAFLGVHEFAKADSITYTSIQVNDQYSQIVLSCPPNSASVCPNTDINISGTEYIGRYFLINFDNTTLTNGHNYTFDITWVIAHDTSDTAFEQESFLMYQTGSANALNDTTIVWDYSTRYDWDFNRYFTSYTYSGQFTATSSSSFYSVLKMENNESFYGIGVGLIHLVDNSSGDELINANYQNTQNIINNANSNTQNIINNQNNSTQQITDTINDNLNECRDSYNLINPSLVQSKQVGNFATTNILSASSNNSLSVNENNYIYGTASSYVVLYVPFNFVSGKAIYNMGYRGSRAFIIYDSSGSVVDVGYSNYVYSPNSSFSGYLGLGINSGDNVNGKQLFFTYSPLNPFEKYGQVCINKIDNVANSINNTNQSIEELNDTITDETLPDIDDSTFGDLEISSETAISDLITMPITILRALNNNLGNTCSPYTIPFGLTGGSQTLTFPCIHPEEYLGSTIWNYIDLFICFFMVYNIAMLIISSFESITSLEDTFNSLYEPRHADTGYKPKHGGD